MCFDKVSDFRKASKEHYEEQIERRFPPSHYLEEGAIKRFGDMIDKLDISPNCHILTGYNPKKHLELLGYTCLLYTSPSPRDS